MTEQPSPAQRLLLNVDEVAELLSIGRSTLYPFLLSGALRSVKVGRRRLIPTDAIPEFVSWLQSGAEAGRSP
jgi:excisionase family DNA binding protein